MGSSTIFLKIAIIWKSMETKDKKLFFHLILIIVVTTFVYLNSFRNGFVYDDHTHILSNVEIRYASNIPQFFVSPFMGLYRPLRSVEYMIIYSLSGENPFGYHLNNLLFHLLNTVMVYLIINL